MAMAHQPLAAVSGLSVGVAAEEGCDLRLDGLRQQRSRALAQNFGERVGELGWLDQLDDIILDHGVSLLRWRSGGLEHPHDTPPQPLTPSPTSAHTSGACRRPIWVRIAVQVASNRSISRADRGRARSCRTAAAA